MCSLRKTRTAFTLIELLTVVAIIVILIAVLVPALSQARIKAQETASLASIKNIEQGLELFRADPVNKGQYPPSHNPDSPLAGQSGGNAKSYTGANWLSDALMGPENLGWDPRATSPLSKQIAWAQTASEIRRINPYVAPDSVRVERDIDVGSQVSRYWDRYPNDARVIVDNSFFDPELNGLNHAILYYRANPAAQSTWGLAAGSTVAPGKLIYDHSDNTRIIERQPIAVNPTSSPLLAVSGNVPNAADTTLTPGSFYEFIQDREVAQLVQQGNTLIRRPSRPGSFLLISPGLDGLYGTNDDITNFRN
jgi:prepilin-type N-terminal cleavage/methylation domain-containing protein